MISHVSLWELQVKFQVDKLKLPLGMKTVQDFIEDVLHHQPNMSLLPIRLSHIYALRDLPLHHRDPFDRLLIAQAQIEHIALISGDSGFQQYEIPLSW